MKFTWGFAAVVFAFSASCSPELLVSENEPTSPTESSDDTTENGTGPSLSFAQSTLIFTKDAQVVSTPTLSGATATAWSISPSLPAGLSFDTSTGTLSGAATGTSANTSYTVTATTADGNASETVTIGVKDVISAWTFVDGNGVNGLNKDTARSANYPMGVVLNSKLYVVWHEATAAARQIRAVVYNGNDSAPGWTFVDGNGVNGINQDTSMDADVPRPIVHNSKLYVAWVEDNGTKSHVRVKVYNGNDSAPAWTSVDGGGVNGLNKDTAQDAWEVSLYSFNSKLYATWAEQNATAIQVRVAVYNGNDSAPAWSFVDGNGVNGLNKNSAESAYPGTMAAFNSKLYLTWYEANAGPDQVRVAVYNGNDSSPTWTLVDGNAATGLNRSVSQDADFTHLIVLNSKLYLVWGESNGNKQVRVRVYNGNDSSPTWTLVDGNLGAGLNYGGTLANSDWRMPVVHNHRLHAHWCEQGQIRVKGYNGADSAIGWTFVDGNAATGLNKDTGRSCSTAHSVSFNSKLYLIWDEDVAGGIWQIRVRVSD